jgi:hypothetical protein
MRYRGSHARILIGLLFAATGPLSAQVATGSMQGTLVAESLQPLPLAEIMAASPALPQPIHITTDANGTFHFLAVPAGTYTVRIRAIGYRPIVFERVVVALGNNTSLGVVTMERLGLQLTDLVVAARIAPIDLTTASSGTNLRAGELDRLPLDRSLNSLISLAPQATYQAADLSFRSEGVNIAGGSIWDNAYFVDGVNVTDPGMGAGGINLPYNFVQEVQVRTGGYEAEFGRAMGGIVNIVTPSGGNTFHADLFTFYTGSGLRTNPLYGRIQTHLDRYSEFDAGASIGGPIKRDRLWFFAAFNPLIGRRDASYTGIAPTTDRQTQYRFAGKLTWQPRPSTHIVLTTSGDPSVHDGVAPITDFGSPSVVLNQDVVLARLDRGGETIALNADHTAANGTLLSATLSRGGYRDDFGPNTTLGATAPRFKDVNGATSGGYGGNGYNHLGRSTAMASLTVPQGAHTAKFGAEYEDNTLDQAEREGVGQIGGFLSQNATTGDYTWVRSTSFAKVGNRVLTTYAQDSWLLNPVIRLNAGLRWEGQWWVGSDTVRQSITNQFAPRVGVVITPGHGGRDKLFASGGRFYEQVPIDGLPVFYGAGSFVFTRYHHDPRVDSTGGAIVLSQAIGDITETPGLKGEYYDEGTVGYERDLRGGLRFSARFITRAVRNVIEDSYTADGTYVVGNPGFGTLDSFPRPIHTYRALELTLEHSGGAHLDFRVSYVLSQNRGNYTGLYAPEGSPPNVSTQFDNHDSLAISTGVLPNDRTHVVKLSGSYRFGGRFSVGASGWIQSGTPLNVYGVNANDQSIFLQPRGTAGRTPATFDANLRMDYVMRSGNGPRITLDVDHIGSPRGPLSYVQTRYQGSDDNGNPIDPEPLYGQVQVYQLPMSARLGVLIHW